MQLNSSSFPVIQSGPSGVKVSAKTFMPLVPLETEVEQWRENTVPGGEGWGFGAAYSSFLMTLECDGNTVNEQGWNKTLRFPHTGRQIWEEPSELLCSAALDAAAAEQSTAELCRPQECGMNRVWLWGRRRWHGEWTASLLFFLSVFSQRDRGSALAKIRKVGDGKWMWEGGGEGEEQDSSPRSPHLSSVIPLGPSPTFFSFHLQMKNK